MGRITFLPSGVAADYTDGESVFEVGKRSGVLIETSCVGKGTCGLCRVKIIEGKDRLNAYNEVEQKHLGNVYFLTAVRLSCQTLPTGGDIIVELAPRKPKP